MAARSEDAGSDANSTVLASCHSRASTYQTASSLLDPETSVETSVETSA